MWGIHFPISLFQYFLCIFYAFEYMKHEGDEFIYNNGEKTIDIKTIDKTLSTGTPEEKLNVIRSELAGNTDKNRFHAAPAEQGKKNSFLKKIGL